VGVDATVKLRAALTRYLDQIDDDGLGASGDARRALSNALGACLHDSALTITGRWQSVDGVLEALITKTGPGRLRIVGAVDIMHSGQGDRLHPLMADLSGEPPEAIIRLGGPASAIAYRHGGEWDFVNSCEEDEWADVLRLSLA
jgi:hypothetical protein